MKCSVKLLLLFVCLLSACKDLTEQITQFDAAINQTTMSVRAFYLQANNFRRDHELALYKYKSFAKIYTAEKNGDTSNTANRYDESYIKIRVGAIEALGNYADQLAALAGSDAPPRSAEQVRALGDKIGENSHTMAILGKSPAIDASKYAQPLSNIAALVTQSYVLHKQKSMVKRCILNAKIPVHEVCDLLKEDLGHMYQSDYLDTVNACRQCAILYWNNFGSTLSVSEKSATLADISSYSKKYFELKCSDPSEAVQAIEDIFDDLAKQVEDKSSNNNQSVKVQINCYGLESVSGRIAQAVKNL